MDNNTIIKCIGYSAEEEQTLQESFDWEEILSGSDCFEKYHGGAYALNVGHTFANVSAVKKQLSYHSPRQDFKILGRILSEEVERYYSCSASVRKVSDSPATDQFQVLLMRDSHILDGPADPNEIREYYVIPGGDIFLYIKNSRRGGVYRYKEGKWQYDAANSSVFEWDMPQGKLSGFLQGVSNSDICLDAFLSYSEKLLMPNHFQSFQDFLHNLEELSEQYIRPSCGLMLKYLQTIADSRYLEYPDFDGMDERIDTLNMHECMQYVLFYNRAALKYGQKFYFTGWKSGKAIRVIQRMRALQQIENLHFSQIGKDELYATAFKKCDSYFYSKKGLANDFTFPGNLLNELKTSDRLKIEQKIMNSCMSGDCRFFDALADIEYYNLNKTFTGATLSKVTEIDRRSRLLTALYKITHNIDYLENLLRLAGGDDYVYFAVNELIKQDHQEKYGQLDAGRYQRVFRALKTINVIKGTAGKRIDSTLPGLLYDKASKPKHKKYKELKMLDFEDLGIICEVGTWHFDGCEKAMKFYSALLLRCRYLDTGDITFYKEIVSDALGFPEVYDIMRYMIGKEEVKENNPCSVNIKKKSPGFLNAAAPFKTIRILQDDILKIETDAIVVPTDSNCSGSGGLDLAVHKKAGKELRLFTDRVLKDKGNPETGAFILTPAFAVKKIRNIFFTVGPTWTDGFHFEEAQLAKCYRDIIRAARNNKIESVAFPCISTGIKRFPEQRAAEIALHTVYNTLREKMYEEPGFYKRGAITFVCPSPKKYAQYRTILKQMILDVCIQVFSPESNPQDFDYDLILLLIDLEDWRDPGDCYQYMQTVKEMSEKEPEGMDEISAYAKTLHQWDYNMCLAYIVYLQRLAYWSGGETHPLGEQIASGTIRKVLFRMKALVG